MPDGVQPVRQLLSAEASFAPSGRFEEAMELCQLKPPYEVMTLSVMADRQKLELPTEKILYIDYQNRMTRIHTAERVIPVSGGFRRYCRIAEGQAFLPCYRAF